MQNGDRVEIITSQNSKGPSRDWLGIVKSAQARSKINQWFKRQFKEENIVRGKELLEKYCKSKSIRLPELMKPEYIKKVELKYGFKDWDSVCAAVGHGGLKEGQVINKMQEEDRKIQKQKITDEQILQKTTEAAQAAAANPEKKKEENPKEELLYVERMMLLFVFQSVVIQYQEMRSLDLLQEDEESRFTEQIV